MAQIIMVTSGKGGVGKSSLCAMVGHALNQSAQRVLLLEMDSGLRGLDIMLGVEDKAVYDLSDVLEGRCEPIKAIVRPPGTANLALIPAPFDPFFTPNKQDLIRLTKGLSHYFDWVLVDTPAGLGVSFEVCAQVADKAVLVVTPDPISVRDGGRVVDLLLQRGVQDISLIINKVEMREHKSQRIMPDLDEVLDTIGIPLLGVIPYEERVYRATATGGTIAPHLLAGKAYANIAARLCGKYVPLALL